ncbi:MAG: NUDIX hydrolase [Nitrospirae bacterium]|nr:NUDIX hydrolase [Nitrospirota bacterium]
MKRQISSGGVIFKFSDGSVNVALVAVKDKTVWCLPKGLVDKGEEPRATALREVEEETGLVGEVIDKIGDISYWYFLKNENIKYHKTVHFFLMKYLSGNTEDHDMEVDDAKWFPIEEAEQVLSYKGDREILRKAKEMIIKHMTAC